MHKRSPVVWCPLPRWSDRGRSGIKVPPLTGRLLLATVAMDVHCCCSLPDGNWLFCLLPFSHGTHSHRTVSQSSPASLDNGQALKPGEAQ